MPALSAQNFAQAGTGKQNLMRGLLNGLSPSISLSNRTQDSPPFPSQDYHS